MKQVKQNLKYRECPYCREVIPAYISFTFHKSACRNFHEIDNKDRKCSPLYMIEITDKK